MTNTELINQIDPQFLYTTLMTCCQCDIWANQVVKQRPFESVDHFLSVANDTWISLEATEWKKVLNQMPVIGDTNRAPERWNSEHDLVAQSSTDTLDQLKSGNEQYLKQFGFRYVVFATGKSGSELLDILTSRLNNSPANEIQVAAEELAKITCLRLLNNLKKSPITTHVLDTNLGKPREGIRVTIFDRENKQSSQSITDQNGRAQDFLPRPILVDNGQYVLRFDNVSDFFPSVSISFRVFSAKEHFHIPLLFSPFGYTTYRGS